MPTPQPPLLLVDNYFDVVQQYPTAALIKSSEAVGREARRVADSRRERTYWMPTTVGDRPHIDLSSNVAGAANGMFLSATIALAAAGVLSHTLAFLVRSAAGTGSTQVLFHYPGSGQNLGIFRASGGVVGFNDGTARSFGIAAPTDDVFHTLIFVFNGPGLVANYFLDGVAAGTANVAYAGRDLSAAVKTYIGAQSGATNAMPGRVGRFAYWPSVQTANVAAIHAALINEDRTAGNILTTATHAWDPFFGQGTQQLSDQIGTAHFVFGDTTAVEFDNTISDQNDPYWAGGHWVGSTLAAGSLWPNPDAIWIDRGHNLWGCQVIVEASSDATMATGRITGRQIPARLVPALPANGNYVVGGDPTTGWCVTEEGALYALLSTTGLTTTSRAWAVRCIAPSAAFTPIVPGIVLGRRTQLALYSAVYDEDQGERTQRSEQSDAGYLATGRTYAWRTLDLDLQVIGDTTYDAQIRTLRTQLFEANQPAMVALNYGLTPERAWLFQAATTRWGFPKKGAYRAGKLSLREVGAKVR